MIFDIDHPDDGHCSLFADWSTVGERMGVIQSARSPFDAPRPLTRPSGTLSPCGSATGGEGWGEGAQAREIRTF
jgi:hypothetical protein